MAVDFFFFSFFLLHSFIFHLRVHLMFYFFLRFFIINLHFLNVFFFFFLFPFALMSYFYFLFLFFNDTKNLVSIFRAISYAFFPNFHVNQYTRQQTVERKISDVISNIIFFEICCIDRKGRFCVDIPMVKQNPLFLRC